MKLVSLILTLVFLVVPILMKAQEPGSKSKAPRQPQRGHGGPLQPMPAGKGRTMRPQPASVQSQAPARVAAQASNTAHRSTIQPEYFSYETESESEVEARRRSQQPLQVVEEETDSMIFDLRQAVIYQAVLEPRFCV